MGTDDHIGNFPPAANEDTDLPVDLPREFRQLPGQLMGEDVLRRDFPTVELSDPLDLFRLETGQVAMNFIDSCPLLRPI